MTTNNHLPTETESLLDVIKKAKPEFNRVCTSDNVKFETECRFAAQQLQKNPTLMAAADRNRSSLFNAIVNISAIGVSLNPATADAYLVPRKPSKDAPMQVCLDISYRGMIKLATDTGVIKWARAQLVYEGDTFKYHGPAKEPTFESDPFAEKGNFKGGYVIAKTIEGDILTEIMTAEQISKIKSKSQSSHSKYSPWNEFEDEMRKKTIIKRAYKTWPRSDGSARIGKAIEVLNEHEGINFDEPLFDEDQFNAYRNSIKNNDSFAYAALEFSYDNEVLASLYQSYKKIWPGTVAELKENMKSLSANGDSMAITYADSLDDLCKHEDDIGIKELLNELSPLEDSFVMSKVSDNAADYINKMDNRDG